MLLVNQKNNVCVDGWGGACVRACVCTLLLLSIFLVFERFLAPCFIELLMFYCEFYWMFLCEWRARKQISLHRDNKVVLYCITFIGHYPSFQSTVLFGQPENEGKSVFSGRIFLGWRVWFWLLCRSICLILMILILHFPPSLPVDSCFR